MLDRVKYIFQIPMEWFRKVDSLLRDIPGVGVMFNKTGDGTRSIGVDFDVLDQRYASSSVKSVDGNLPNDQGEITLRSVGTPDEYGSFPTGEVTQDSGVLWQSGGSNGAKFQILFKGEEDGGTHNVFSARLTFSKDGVLLKAEKIENGGMFISA